MTTLTLYNVLKFLHIVATIAFAGGIASRQIVRAYASAPTMSYAARF